MAINIQKVETRDEEGGNLLIMVLDYEVEVRVEKFGTAQYRLTLRNVHPEGGEDPMKTLLGVAPVGTDCTGPEFWGVALIWAEPITVAHVVKNFLDNA